VPVPFIVKAGPETLEANVIPVTVVPVVQLYVTLVLALIGPVGLLGIVPNAKVLADMLQEAKTLAVTGIVVVVVVFVADAGVEIRPSARTAEGRANFTKLESFIAMAPDNSVGG
jgi:hypothetical protein